MLQKNEKECSGENIRNVAGPSLAKVISGDFIMPAETLPAWTEDK